MKLNQLQENIPGEVKQRLTQFFAKNISSAHPGNFPGNSLAKRLVGNVLKNIFFLRNATNARPKHIRKKITDILYSDIVGATKAMANDHPELMKFNHEEFVERVLDNIIQNVDVLRNVLTMNLQEARTATDHPIIDEIKQAAKDREYYEKKVRNVSVDEVVKIMIRHFGQPYAISEDRWVWNYFINDDLTVINHSGYVGIYLA